MGKHLVVCGHGAGDPGAIGNGYNEASFTRDKLKPAIEKYAKQLKNNTIEFYDISKNLFAQTNAGGGAYSLSGYTSVTEVHLDSAASSVATGGHVIVSASFKADSNDLAIAAVVKKYVGWWGSVHGSSGISYRNNLLNLNVCAQRSINYRLVELGFISNASDVAKIVNNLDAMAKEFVEAITGESLNGTSAPAQSAPVDVCSAGQNNPVQKDGTKSTGHVDRFGPKGDKLWVNGWQIGNYAHQFIFIMDRKTGKELARMQAPGISRPDVNKAYSTSGKVGYDVNFKLSQFKGKQVYVMMRCTNDPKGNTAGGYSDIHWKSWYHDIK